MKRALFATALLFALTSISKAQIIPDTVFQERFDNPPVLGTTGNSGGGLTPSDVFTLTDTLARSNPNSYVTRAGNSNQQHIYWQTPVLDFSTYSYAIFEFDHIAKVHNSDRARILMSLDGGTTFSVLNGVTNSTYLGNAPGFGTGTGQNTYFNELSYNPDWGGPTIPPTGPIVFPNNTWWKREAFDITTSVSGESQVVFRFELEFPALAGGSPPINTIMPGWFLDNILIYASTCELIPPRINFTFPTSLTFQNQPQGLQPCEGNYAVSFLATDNVAIEPDSVFLYYRIDGGPWTKKTMFNWGPSNPNRYQDTIPNLVRDDTVEWYVEVYDVSCPNKARRPQDTSQNYSFFIGEEIPAKCGPFNCGDVVIPFIVDAIPWTENFDGPAWVAGSGNGTTGSDHRGVIPITNGNRNWSVFPALVGSQSGLYGWSVRGGGTPTAFTGPSSDHTTGNGRFVYTHAVQGHANPNLNRTQLTTHCIKLPDDDCLGLEFYYHMYGQHIDHFWVDIDTGENNAAWVDSIYVAQGQQQSSSSDPWARGFVSLDDFRGKMVRIRFFANKPNNGIRGDVALDDIRIFYVDPIDAEATRILNPLPDGCNFSSAEDVTIVVRNSACLTITELPVAYQVGSNPIVRDTVRVSLESGDSTVFTFSQAADLSAVGNYNIRAWTEINGDSDRSNDSTDTRSVFSPPVVTTFPHIISFDEPGDSPGNGTFGAGAGTLATGDWARVPDPSAPGVSGVYAFMVGSDMTPTRGTGPFTDQSGFGNYLYAEGSFGNATTIAQFVSNCFDLTGMSNPTLDFFTHIHVGSNELDSLVVNIIRPGTDRWFTPPGGRIINSPQNDETDMWTPRRIDLTPYNNGQVRIRFAVYRRGTGERSDVALDNIWVYDRPQQDAGIINISPPNFGVPVYAAPQPRVEIRNYGTSPLTSVPVVLEVTPLCGPNQGVPVVYNETFTGTIAPGNQTFYTFTGTINWPVGRVEVKAYTAIPGDNNTFNDEWRKYVTPFDRYEIPFEDNFDDCDHSSKGWFTQGAKQQFEVGTPTHQITAAPSPPNAFVTNPGGTYYQGTEEVLRVPPLTGWDTVVGTEIRFSQYFHLANNHGARIERLNSQGNWIALAPINALGVGVNWFIQAGTVSSNYGDNGPAWIGNSQGWINSSYPLFEMDMTSQILQLRYTMLTNSSMAGLPNAGGYAIDNVSIYIPPQNSAAPVLIRTVDPLRFPDIDHQVRVRIENTGAKLLDSCLLSVSFDGGVNYGPEEWYVFNPPLMRGQTREVIYPEIWSSPPSDDYDICAYTRRPNGKGDNLPSDDTLCVVLSIFPEIDMAAIPDNEYCNDFEDPTIFNFLSGNAFTVEDGRSNWEMGSPNAAPITSAFSGSNAWMTDLSDDYFSRDSSGLFSPVFIIDSSKTYELEFMHYFVTEKYHDGGTVEVTQDGGQTWMTVGRHFRPEENSTWFNQPFITGLNIIKPGWTGNSNGWQNAKVRIDFISSNKIMFRFRMGSDNNIENVGWAIDDFCFRESTDDSEYEISTEEYLASEDGILIGLPAPNPTSGLTHIGYDLPRAGKLHFRITNMLGQVVYENIEDRIPGQGQFHVDAATWNSGVYIITAIYEGKPYTSKLIVTK